MDGADIAAQSQRADRPPHSQGQYEAHPGQGQMQGQGQGQGFGLGQQYRPPGRFAPMDVREGGGGDKDMRETMRERDKERDLRDMRDIVRDVRDMRDSREARDVREVVREVRAAKRPLRPSAQYMGGPPDSMPSHGHFQPAQLQMNGGGSSTPPSSFYPDDAVDSNSNNNNFFYREKFPRVEEQGFANDFSGFYPPTHGHLPYRQGQGQGMERGDPMIDYGGPPSYPGDFQPNMGNYGGPGQGQGQGQHPPMQQVFHQGPHQVSYFNSYSLAICALRIKLCRWISP